MPWTVIIMRMCVCVSHSLKKIEHMDHKVLKLKMHVHVGGRVLQGGMGSAETEAICGEKLTNGNFCLSDRFV